jgi:hypothetical protein
MGSLRQIIAQGRKRIGLLVGAGGPASISTAAGKPLIPTIGELTKNVLDALGTAYGATLKEIEAELPTPNIENILSHVRTLASVIGTTNVHGLDAHGYEALSQAICDEIGKIANQPLPDSVTPYSGLVAWIGGTDREHAVEIFTTNYESIFDVARHVTGNCRILIC